MFKKLTILASLAMLFLPALAFGEDFVWSYSGTGVTASGSLTATPTANPNEYFITDLTGLRNGNAITAFFGGGVFGDGSTADNLLYSPGTPQLSTTSTSGIIFTTSDGSFNLYWGPAGGFGPTYYEYTIFSNSVPGIDVANFTVAPTPEPSTYVMVSSALAGLALLRRKRTI